MKSFLKENMVLVAGVTLPLLLTLIFFAVTLFDRASVDPPRYSLVFATNYYHHNSNALYKISVKDKQVRFLYFPPKEDNNYYNRQLPRLFVYNPILGSSQEIELPEIEDPEVKMDKIVKDLQFKKVTNIQKSPDGYVFEHEYRGNGNLMTELFGGGYRSRSHYCLRKESNRVRVPSALQYNSQFIGWILDDQETANGQ